MTITRKLPNSNVTRQLALNKARETNTNTPPAQTALSPATIARLIQVPMYNSALQSVDTAKAQYNSNTPVKDLAVATCRLLTNHFIQVFNLGVDRGKYAAAQRAYFGLDVDSGALPDLRSEEMVRLWAHKLVTGDLQRTTDGGLPMANPDISEVQTALTAMETQMNAHDTLAVTLNSKQEAVDALNPEADKLIKRIWDEVETYFGEGTPESKRNSARVWGVVYVTEGAPAMLSGLVKNASGNPLEGASVTINETGATATTNHEGRYTIQTSVVGSVTLGATLGATTGTQTANIPDHAAGINVSVGDIVIA